MCKTMHSKHTCTCLTLSYVCCGSREMWEELENVRNYAFKTHMHMSDPVLCVLRLQGDGTRLVPDAHRGPPGGPVSHRRGSAAADRAWTRRRDRGQEPPQESPSHALWSPGELTVDSGSYLLNQLSLFSKEFKLLFYLGKQKLIFCFLGTSTFVFSPPLQNFYSKNRADIFVKLNFVLKNSDAKKKFAPSHSFF